MKEGFCHGYIKHSCTEYKIPPKVLQCFKCQKYGHGILNCCETAYVCIRCSGSHNHTECQVDRGAPTCANCKGTHAANFRGCTEFKKALVEQQSRQQQQLQQQQQQSQKSYKAALVGSHANVGPSSQNQSKQEGGGCGSTESTISLLSTMAVALEELLTITIESNSVPSFSVIAEALSAAASNIMKINVDVQVITEQKSRMHSSLQQRKRANAVRPISDLSSLSASVSHLNHNMSFESIPAPSLGQPNAVPSMTSNSVNHLLLQARTNCAPLSPSRTHHSLMSVAMSPSGRRLMPKTPTSNANGLNLFNNNGCPP